MAANIEIVPNACGTQISFAYNLLLSCHIIKKKKHGVWQWYCRALCKNLKRSNWASDYRRMRFKLNMQFGRISHIATAPYGGHHNIKMPSYPNRDSNFKDRTVPWQSYLYNWNTIARNTVFVLKPGTGGGGVSLSQSHVKDKTVSRPCYP